MKKTFISFLLFLGFLCFSQDISGLWVAERLDSLNPRDFYAIMYLKVDNTGNVVGYTYDEEAGGWCNYKVEGTYSTKNKKLNVKNTDLIQKTENHKGSKYKLNYLTKDNNEYLEGTLKIKGSGGVWGAIASVAVGVGVGVATGGRVIIAANINLGQVQPKRYVIYQRPKVEDLNEIEDYDKLKPFIDLLEGNEPVNEEPIVEEPIVTEPEEPIIEEPIVTQPEEPIEEDPIEEVEETDETIALTEDKEERKDELLKSHVIKNRKVLIEIIDKNLEDGDRISIYINDKLFKFNIEVLRTPQYFEFTLPSTQKIHKVHFVANNLGRIPPNTATVKYTIDNVTYEQPLSTDEDENKYLEFILE